MGPGLQRALSAGREVILPAEAMTLLGVKAIRTAIRKGQKEGRECGGGKRPFWEEGSGEASCGERGS